MPTYTATAPDGRKVSATGPTPPSEAEWDDIFASVKASTPSAPFDVAASRAKLDAANQAYTANAALTANQNESMLGHIADQFTPGKVASRAWEGAKGYYEGVAGGAAGTIGAALTLPVYVADAAVHPVATVEKAKEALKVGAALAVATGQDPMEASNKVWDTFAQYASDPGNVGRAVGGLAGSTYVVKSPLGQRSIDLTKKIASGLVNKIPGVEEWRASGPSPPPSAPPSTTTTPAPASAPPLGVPPPVSNNVTPPPNPQPPPATTPANTPAASAAPSPAVRAALPIVRDWTVDEMQQVTKLPVDERQTYVKLRQVGDTHAEAIRTLDFQRESQALRDQASNARAMVGSSKAASDLFGTSTPDAVQKIHELAPGPSRPPLAGLTAAMDARFKQLISDPKMAWLLPLLGGAGLGALAQRKDAN